MRTEKISTATGQQRCSWAENHPVHMTLKFHFWIALIICCTLACGQSNKEVPLPFTPRVDTTNVEVKAIYYLWKSYLNSHPDSIYNNPYWSEAEKMHYKDFDLARRWVYGYKAGESRFDILSIFKPKVLYIDKEREYYCIKTFYYGNETLWALQRVYAARENGQWKLFNALPILTRDWQHKRAGLIEYVFSPTHKFNDTLATQSGRFVDSVIKTFQLPPPKLIEYYITPDWNELAQICGLDYTLGPTSGRAYWENNQVFSATGSEWYPHELAHIAFAPYKDAHWLLSEGIATLVGGATEASFGQLIKEADSNLVKNATLTFQQLLDQPFQFGGTRFFYTTGAVLCKMALEKGRVDLLKRLLTSGKSQNDLYEALELVLGIRKDTLDQVWRKKIAEYAR